MSGGDPFRLAEGLVQEAGLSSPRAIEPLAGGRNNRVFRVDLSDGGVVALKCYHHDPRDPRDRLRAEWTFLVNVWAHGARNVPQPLAKRMDSHAALYGFVAGERAMAATVDLVEQAATFVAAINRIPVAPDIEPASEACFSLADHLETIERRVARLVRIDADMPYAGEAQAFVADQVVPAWRLVRADIDRRNSGHEAVTTQAVTRTVLSPSDFGFHNALVDAHGRATFIDFEYAGRDDPAKLICDFFCQPEVPVPLECLPFFRDSLAGALNLDADAVRRIDLLLDAYRIKWVCIMLNEFLAVGASRRAFAAMKDEKRLAERQLRRAEQYLGLITH